MHTIPRRTTRVVEVGGYQIPADSHIFLSLLAVHRDERFDDDPESFRPDRWTSEFEDDLPDFAYLPFGGGRRTCLGAGQSSRGRARDRGTEASRHRANREAHGAETPNYDEDKKRRL
ncbi:cytochrome P450 [Haladaptatus sp. NG-SE-30]